MIKIMTFLRLDSPLQTLYVSVVRWTFVLRVTGYFWHWLRELGGSSNGNGHGKVACMQLEVGSAIERERQLKKEILKL